jgi:hypothetical protein
LPLLLLWFHQLLWLRRLLWALPLLRLLLHRPTHPQLLGA